MIINHDVYSTEEFCKKIAEYVSKGHKYVLNSARQYGKRYVFQTEDGNDKLEIPVEEEPVQEAVEEPTEPPVEPEAAKEPVQEEPKEEEAPKPRRKRKKKGDQ